MALNEQAVSRPSPSAKSKRSRAKSSPNTGPMSPATTMSAPLPQSDLLPMELPELMSSLEVFHAKTLAWQGSRQGLQMEREAGCGVSAFALLAKFDPASQSLKTSQTCFLGRRNSQGLGLAEYSQTWPLSGMMQSGTIYQLPTLVPGTGGGEFGFLPTVIKSTASGSASNRWFGNPKYKNNLHEYLRDGPGDPKHVRPDFCEMIMGFPIGHTELQPAEMQSHQ